MIIRLIHVEAFPMGSVGTPILKGPCPQTDALLASALSPAKSLVIYFAPAAPDVKQQDSGLTRTPVAALS